MAAGYRQKGKKSSFFRHVDIFRIFSVSHIQSKYTKKHKNNSANAVLNRRVSYLNPSAARDAKSKTPDAGFNATPNKPKHKWNLMIFSITSNTAL